MKTTTTILLALALVKFIQAAPIETRDDKGPTFAKTNILETKGPGSPPRRRDTGWNSIPGGDAKIQEDKGPARRSDSGWNSVPTKPEDVGWNSEPAKPLDSGWGKRDIGWDSEPAKPLDWGWNSEPAKPNDSAWGP
ncbi:hypothetical protein BGZ97_001600 [Linnemannia gamsii]|uniref:Uncharacterized protein n=1 Tax=Linnemannia gamsii TaxID=64522 RepID=A0A9P6QXJ4_9FUNG|nr:hypothetical protein BGZ97_001600 [Linnemannia gamsii]